MIIFKYLKVDFTVESGWFCECVCVSSKTSSKHVASCVASNAPSFLRPSLGAGNTAKCNGFVHMYVLRGGGSNMMSHSLKTLSGSCEYCEIQWFCAHVRVKAGGGVT